MHNAVFDNISKSIDLLCMKYKERTLELMYMLYLLHSLIIVYTGFNFWMPGSLNYFVI